MATKTIRTTATTTALILATFALVGIMTTGAIVPAAINEEIASGSGSEAASAAKSESESTYKPKYKSKDGGSGSPIPGESTAASDSTSDVSNNGTIAQDQTLSSPVQVNDNNFGSDESRSAVVGFDLGFEQFTAETGSAEPDIGTRVPIVIP